MTRLARIREFVQEYADMLAELLNLEVTVIDEQSVRIAGTGFYRQSIGQPAPRGSLFQTILDSGKPGMILDIQSEDAKCRSCIFNLECKELATIGFPVMMDKQPIGVVGLIGFSPQQKDKMMDNLSALWKLLKHSSQYLGEKIRLVDADSPIPPAPERESPQAAGDDMTFDKIIGKHPAFLEVVEKAKHIASSTSTVLIRGESGTGKEVLARAIHNHSGRANRPFVAVNCAAIPENLLESELFGYEGGAFTGSKKEGKPGKFELAHTGTIFLDEIGDMPLSLQPKLLRVLQEKKIERIGGQGAFPVDVRVIAATNKDLERMVANGTFREDLYYRINVIPLRLMPLRERREDIPALLDSFLDKHCRLLGKEPLTIEPLLKQWLQSYHWPGNIRQLENAVEYMVNMARSSVITRQDLPDYLLNKQNGGKSGRKQGLEEMLDEYEKSILQRYLLEAASTSEKARVAKELNISLSTLYRKLEKYRLS